MTQKLFIILAKRYYTRKLPANNWCYPITRGDIFCGFAKLCLERDPITSFVMIDEEILKPRLIRDNGKVRGKDDTKCSIEEINNPLLTVMYETLLVNL